MGMSQCTVMTTTLRAQRTTKPHTSGSGDVDCYVRLSLSPNQPTYLQKKVYILGSLPRSTGSLEGPTPPATRPSGDKGMGCPSTSQLSPAQPPEQDHPVQGRGPF